MYTPLRYSFTGLFGEKNAGCGSLVDSYVDVRIDGLQSQVTSRILFQNNTKHAFGDALYYARVAEGSTITSVDCLIERDSSINRKLDPACRLERREVRNASHEGSFFTCNLGTIESDKEVVVFLRYHHDAILHGNVAMIKFPLPGRLGEKMVTRQGNGIMDWNGSHMFSFMALDIQVTMPGQILNVSSNSHLVCSTITDNIARIDIENHILLGQDDFEITIEADGLDFLHREKDMALYHTLDSKTRQSSLYSGTTEDSALCDSVLDEDWPEGTHFDIQYEHSMMFDKYIRNSPTIYEDDPCYIDEQFCDKISTFSAPLIYRSEGYSNTFFPPGTRYDGRGLESFLFDDDEECDEDFDFSELSYGNPYHQYTIKACDRNGSTLNAKPEGGSWYEELSDDECEGDQTLLLKTFTECNEDADVKLGDEDCTDDEWDPEPCITYAVQSPSAYFDSVFVGTALAVSPTRPKVVEISPRSSIAGGDEDYARQPFEEEHHESIQTPPRTPVRRNMHTPTFGIDSAWSQELWAIVSAFMEQVKNSANIFLNLTDKFSNLVGIPLHILTTHTGAQAYNLPQIAQWVREGIWANVLAVHYLQSIMDCDELAESDETFREHYDWLLHHLQNSLLHQEKRLLGDAIDYSLSVTELAEMAKELFDECQEMKRGTDCALKRLEIHTLPLSAPVSPGT